MEDFRLEQRTPQQLSIGRHSIGIGHPPLLIAEIGINHNGSLLRAKELVLKAKECGAVAVKFQKRHLPSIYTQDVLENLDNYEHGFQYLIPILKECELSNDEMEELKNFSDALDLTFLCTPFDIQSARFLKTLDVPAYKVSSADLTNMLLIEELASYGKPLLLSTGMSIDSEVRYTVDYLRSMNAQFVLLHCVSSYPVDPQKANLERIKTLAAEYDSLVGYSGHDLGTSLSLVATSFGACIIEKHFTTDRSLPGPDHKVSLLPEELRRLAARLREEVANGTGLRVTDVAEKNNILQGELLNKHVFRKGIVAAEDISEGDLLTKENLTLKSPGGHTTGQDLSRFLGTIATKDFTKDTPVTLTEESSGSISKTKDSVRAPDWGKWGLVVRYHDFPIALKSNPEVLEFHLTLQDVSLPLPTESLLEHAETLKDCILRVHCCEYLDDRLFDLCSSSTETRKRSFTMLQRVLDLTRDLSEYFASVPPAVVFNIGAMTLQHDTRGVSIDEEELYSSILSLRTHKVTLLAQNMPPYPWYYGGQWKGHYFLEPEELIRFCKRTGHKLCLDLSHAAMAARYLNLPLSSYLLELKPYVEHIHVSDAQSIEGEGTQIGEGSINFEEVIAIFKDYQGSWVPEIWQGHLDENAGAKTAIRTFSSYFSKLAAALPSSQISSTERR